MQKRLENHLVVCGSGHVGYRITELLHQLGETFVVITRDIRPEWKVVMQKRAARFIEGDARSETCLRAAGIETARALIVVTDNDLVNIEIAMDVQRLCPKLPLIVRVFDRFLADRAEREMRVRNVLSPALLTAPVFVAAAQGDEMIRAFEIAGLRLNVVQIRIKGDAAMEQTVESFCRGRSLFPLSLQRTGAQKACCDPHEPLAPGDILLAVASGKATEQLRNEGFLPRRETLTDRNRPWRRFINLMTHPHNPLQAARAVWRRSPSMLRFAFVALHGLFLLSVVVFHANLPSCKDWVDAMYFTVTIMTTVGFEDFNLHHTQWWLKLYGCVVMIGGAGLVAILFGLITDYIVTARVEQALGRRTTRLKDHIVVIGLGDVGTRVAEELYRIGEPVVAIERDVEHESVPSLQDHMHVIIGDANRESAMLQANIAQAHALIVTTTTDVDSLRIAHQAETLNPALRTVIRIYDSELANKLGLGLGIDRTVNAAATAAATFVTCALQTGVVQSFMIGKRLFALRVLSAADNEALDVPGKEGPALLGKGKRAAKQAAGFPSQEAARSHRGGFALEDVVIILEEYDPVARCFTLPRLQLENPAVTGE